MPAKPKPSPLLRRYAPIADGIAALFFPFAEVALHDLQSQTVVHLANNLSRRALGDASAMEELAVAGAADVLGPYEKLNWDGRRMRSISVNLREGNGQAAGVMCINLNVAVFDEMRVTLDLLVKGVGLVDQPTELFKDDWQERINTFVHAWLSERGLALNSLHRKQRRELLEALYTNGAFQAKSAAPYLANVLGMGRATVYKLLSELKAEESR